MFDSLFQLLDLIEPGDLVIYSGSLTDCHGLYIAQPCPCRRCLRRDACGSTDARYLLLNPWGDRDRDLFCVRRQSITRSAACA